MTRFDPPALLHSADGIGTLQVERQNTTPSGIMGCERHYTNGSLPLEETGWTAPGLDTDSPMIHPIPDMTPATYLYRARYLVKKLRYGNFGDPAECAVSG